MCALMVLSEAALVGTDRLMAAVAGGGIAGLASALSLAQAGWQVTVLERAPVFGEVGAGLAVTGNGMTALAALWLDDAVRAAGYQTVTAGYQDPSGRWLMRIPGARPDLRAVTTIWGRSPQGAVFADELAAARERFAAWAPWIRALVATTPASRLMRHDVYHLSQGLPKYVCARVVVVGDAAHAALPTAGQGAATALEDAVCVGRMIAAPVRGRG